MLLLRMAQRDAKPMPIIHLSGDAKFLWDMSLCAGKTWSRGSLWKADIAIGYISESICPNALAEIWTAIANDIPTYLFFEPGVNRELHWHCRRAAAQWPGFTTVHRDRLRNLFEEVLADWRCQP
jgi:hypothetical protein